MLTNVRHTNFATESTLDFEAKATRVVTASPDGPVKHTFIPTLLEHPSGHLLLTCRWDAEGGLEGDDTNEQALYFSSDAGDTWTMANHGLPIVTIANGTPHERRSALTHSFLFHDLDGRTWLYYSINQPFTWGADRPNRSTGGEVLINQPLTRGADRPNRSTGGGEIRKIEITFDGETWVTTGDSTVAWGFLQPVADGAGGLARDVRLVIQSGILRLRDGRLLMAVGGRSTVREPEGAFWRLNRCWVLESTDDGTTWSESHFIAGSDSLCCAEPTIVETSVPGELICIMRVQYATGAEMVRSDSYDGGRTWSAPVPTGLPNSGTSGTRPFMVRLRNGMFVLLDCSEHGNVGRTGASLYLADEADLRRNRWSLVKTILVEGAGTYTAPPFTAGGYGWVTELQTGEIVVLTGTFHREEQHINFAKVPLEWLAGTVVEPVAVNDNSADDRPTLRARGATPDGKSLHFSNARGRARATSFGGGDGYPIDVTLGHCIEELPTSSEFHFCRVGTSLGRWPAFSVTARPAVNGNFWLHDNRGWVDTGTAIPLNRWVRLRCIFRSPLQVSVTLDESPLGDGSYLTRTTGRPDSLIIGALEIADDPCSIFLGEVTYATPGPPPAWRSIMTDNTATATDSETL